MNIRLVGIIGAVGLLLGLAWYYGGFTSMRRCCGSVTGSATGTQTAKSSLHVINVLDKALYDDAHIKGSEQIDSDVVEKVAQNWDKNSTIVVYCANYMCSASRDIAKKLTAMGFKNTKAYEGGTAEWYQLSQKDPSYAIVGPAQEKYLKVPIKAPQEHPADVAIIEAEALKSLLQGAGLA